MNVETKQSFELILILSRGEAEWLKSYIQNGSKGESDIDQSQRAILYETLGEGLESIFVKEDRE